MRISFGFLLFALLEIVATASAQCLMVVQEPAGTPIVSRDSDNHGDGVTLETTQSVQGVWFLTLTANLYFQQERSSSMFRIDSRDQEFWITNGTPAGYRVSTGIGTALEPRGNGQYFVLVSAKGACGGVIYTLTPAGGARLSPPLNIQRPRIDGPGGASSPYGLWWLGGFSDDDNGYYNRGTFSVNRNGATGAPNWTVIQNATKVSLSCTTCDLPLVTSVEPSANCTYDIALQVDFAGFKSEPFLLNVNAPYYMESGGLSSTENLPPDGWITSIPYVNRDRCTYGMPSIALNEQFWPFENITANNWAKPQAKGIPSYGGYTWWIRSISLNVRRVIHQSSKTTRPIKWQWTKRSKLGISGKPHNRLRHIRAAEQVSPIYGSWGAPRCYSHSLLGV